MPFIFEYFVKTNQTDLSEIVVEIGNDNNFKAS